MADGTLIDINRFPVKGLPVDRLRRKLGWKPVPACPPTAISPLRRSAPSPIRSNPNGASKAAFHVMVTKARMPPIACRYDTDQLVLNA